MKKPLTTALRILGIIFVFGSAQTSAQWRSNNDVSLMSALFNASPIQPGDENVFSPDQTTIFVSGFVGFNNNMNLGDFNAKCDCEFDGKFGIAKFGLAFGGDVTYVFSREWGVMTKVYYDDKHTNETLERDVNEPIDVGSQVIIRPVRHEEKVKVTLAYAALGLFMRYQPRLERWYVFAGSTIGKNVSNKIEQTSTILTPDLTFRDGTTERIVSQDPIDGRNNIRAEGLIGAGYDFMMSPRVFLSPEVHVAYPITKISTDDNWKVLSIRFTVGLKYEAF